MRKIGRVNGASGPKTISKICDKHKRGENIIHKNAESIIRDAQECTALRT